MNRNEIIEWLIDDDLDSLRQDSVYGNFGYIAGILRDGFVGYDNYTDDQLRADILERDPDEVLEG